VFYHRVRYSDALMRYLEREKRKEKRIDEKYQG
jgi:hypothetical protein